MLAGGVILNVLLYTAASLRAGTQLAHVSHRSYIGFLKPKCENAARRKGHLMQNGHGHYRAPIARKKKGEESVERGTVTVSLALPGIRDLQQYGRTRRREE